MKKVMKIIYPRNWTTLEYVLNEMVWLLGFDLWIIKFLASNLSNETVPSKRLPHNMALKCAKSH